MLKVLVYDSGWGGELFADYLENELAVVEVIRVIDWRHAPHAQYSRDVIRVLTELMIYPYVGKVDVIVLASYVVTEATLVWLRERYPAQIFLGFEIRLFNVVKYARFGRILVAGEKSMLSRPRYTLAKYCIERTNGIEIVELDCDGWTTLIDNGEMTDAIIRQTLRDYNWRKDMILLYNTHLLDIKPRLERIFGWRMQVLDEFRPVFKRICIALKLNRCYLRPAGTLGKAERENLRMLRQTESVH